MPSDGRRLSILERHSAVEREIRVAIAGFWHVHATGYAEMVRDDPRSRLVGIWDPDRTRGESAAATWEVPYFQDLDELLKDSELDAVIVTNATADHEAVIVRIAQMGKHIFAEKLLGPTREAVDRILAAVNRAGVVLVVSLPRLYEGYTVAIDQLLAEKDFGQPSYVRVRLAHDGASADWLPARFYDPVEAISGALTDLGCHPVYLVDHFLGQRPVSVSATYGHATGRQVDDNAVVAFGYGDGSIGVAESGFVTSQSPFTIELHWPQASVFYGFAGEDQLDLRSDGHSEQVGIPAGGPTPFEQWLTHIANGTKATDNVESARRLTDLVERANDAATRLGSSLPVQGASSHSASPHQGG
jgi:1,5-anhydro-D-fructose reductase (1,5-anhydro-D-mannitol-forming)